MASLLVVTGPPGAGKSTVARILADRFEPSVLVEGDAFFGFLARGAVPPWLPESNEQNEVVTQAAASAAGRYVSGGYMTVYDGVVGPWFLPTFATATGLGRVEYVVLLPSVERCIDHVGARQGHGFADEGATRKMHEEFARADIEQRHLLLDPPRSARGRRGPHRRGARQRCTRVPHSLVVKHLSPMHPRTPARGRVRRALLARP